MFVDDETRSGEWSFSFWLEWVGEVWEPGEKRQITARHFLQNEPHVPLGRGVFKLAGQTVLLWLKVAFRPTLISFDWPFQASGHYLAHTSHQTSLCLQESAHNSSSFHICHLHLISLHACVHIWTNVQHKSSPLAPVSLHAVHFWGCRLHSSVALVERGAPDAVGLLRHAGGVVTRNDKLARKWIGI